MPYQGDQHAIPTVLLAALGHREPGDWRVGDLVHVVDFEHPAAGEVLHLVRSVGGDAWYARCGANLPYYLIAGQFVLVNTASASGGAGLQRVDNSAELPPGATAAPIASDAETVSPCAPEASPEKPPVPLCSGWLEDYAVRRDGREWKYVRWVWEEGWQGKRHRRHVPARKLSAVREAIANGCPVAAIEEILGSPGSPGGRLPGR